MGVWTAEEIGNYKQVVDPRLDEIYRRAGVGEDPNDRARYLAKDFLEACMVDHEVIMRTAGRDGRPAALNMLEQWALAQDIEQQQ